MSEGTADVPTAPATPAGPTSAAMAAVSTSVNNITSPDANAAGGDGGDGGDSSNAPDVDMQDSSLVAITATPTTPSSTPQKERHSLTLDQRRALRRWANTQPSRPSHKQCIEWFHREYQQTISQSTVSHSLSPKYARLDGEPQLSGSRLRFGNWPEVEKLVLLWYQQMTNTGRHPTNEELADKAKNIFTQLPRHRGEEPPEFSPGWIHRFKKRYGLLIRRQRRQSALGSDPPGNGDLAADIGYLVDNLPSLMDVAADTNPVVIRETIQRTLGIEPSIAVCTRVRNEIVHYTMAATPVATTAVAGASGSGPPGLSSATTTSEASAATAAAAAVAAAAAAAASAASVDFGASRGNSHDPQQQQQQQQQLQQQQQQQGNGVGANHQPNGNGNTSTDAGPGSSSVYPSPDDDPEMVLQNALRQLQQQEEVEVAEAAAAATAAVATVAAAAGTAADAADDIRRRAELSVPVTPSKGAASANASGNTSASSATATDQPRRCPFCVNQRMLRTINEAVDHMASHVVVE